MAERGFGRVAHGTHGIHGKGGREVGAAETEGGGVFYHERRDGRRAGTGDVARELRGGTRMAERGNGGVAHGTHGIHGIGDERREPRKRKGAEFV